MVPHRRDSDSSVAKILFNKKLNISRLVVENTFVLLKLSFRELNGKCNLHVSIVSDVVTCCALLHNILLNESHEDIERLHEVM